MQLEFLQFHIREKKVGEEMSYLKELQPKGRGRESIKVRSNACAEVKNGDLPVLILRYALSIVIDFPSKVTF